MVAFNIQSFQPEAYDSLQNAGFLNTPQGSGQVEKNEKSFSQMLDEAQNSTDGKKLTENKNESISGENPQKKQDEIYSDKTAEADSTAVEENAPSAEVSSEAMSAEVAENVSDAEITADFSLTDNISTEKKDAALSFMTEETESDVSKESFSEENDSLFAEYSSLTQNILYKDVNADESVKADNLRDDDLLNISDELSGEEIALAAEKFQPVVNTEQNTVEKPETDSSKIAFDGENSKVKKSSSKKESPIEIIDERSKNFTLRDENGKANAVEGKFSKPVLNGENSVEMSFTLNNVGDGLSDVTQVAGDANGYTKADFSSLLSKEIGNSAGEFVRSGSLVLKNNGKGSINLILRPEELGNVKINLELSDNQVSGKIVVASKEAYEAFKQNIDNLKEAFIAGGFETNGFELSWAGSDGNGYGNGQYDRNENAYVADNFGRNVKGSAYVDNMPDSLPEIISGNTYVNLVA